MINKTGFSNFFNVFLRSEKILFLKEAEDEEENNLIYNIFEERVE